MKIDLTELEMNGMSIIEPLSGYEHDFAENAFQECLDEVKSRHSASELLMDEYRLSWYGTPVWDEAYELFVLKYQCEPWNFEYSELKEEREYRNFENETETDYDPMSKYLANEWC